MQTEVFKKFHGFTVSNRGYVIGLNGHKIVSPCINYRPKEGELKGIAIHTLIAKLFLGEPPAGKTCVRTKNGNRKDLRVENLEYTYPRRSGKLKKVVHGPRGGASAPAVGDVRTGAMDDWAKDEWHPLPFEVLTQMGDEEHIEYCERWSKAHPLAIESLAERLLVAIQNVYDNLDRTSLETNPLNRYAE